MPISSPQRNNNNHKNNNGGGSNESSNNNGSNNNSDSMLSFEEDEEGGESLEELTADGTPLPSTSADALNDNSQQAPTMVRLKSTDSDNNVENLSRRLDICWRDVYYDSSRDNEEKIYEDLCYITFSSTLPEVVVVLCVLPPKYTVCTRCVATAFSCFLSS